MRHTQAERMEIIHLVEHSELSIRKTLDELEVPRSTFYNWYRRYQEDGHAGLADQKPGPRQFWNQIPESVQEQIVELADFDGALLTDAGKEYPRIQDGDVVQVDIDFDGATGTAGQDVTVVLTFTEG